MKPSTYQEVPVRDFGGMEIAYFKLKPDVSEATLLEAVALIERDFFAELPGLLGHSLIKGWNGLYADITFAVTRARVEEICAQWLDNPHAQRYLELLDERSVQMTFWTRL